MSILLHQKGLLQNLRANVLTRGNLVGLTQDLGLVLTNILNTCLLSKEYLLHVLGQNEGRTILRLPGGTKSKVPWFWGWGKPIRLSSIQAAHYGLVNKFWNTGTGQTKPHGLKGQVRNFQTFRLTEGGKNPWPLSLPMELHTLAPCPKVWHSKPSLRSGFDGYQHINRKHWTFTWS